MPVRWFRIIASIVTAAVLTMLLVSMFAVELTRMFVSQAAQPPLPMPGGVDIRYSDRLVAFIGNGTSTGHATAVTLGSVILVGKRFDGLTRGARCDVIRHELVHVQQRARYGRLYLPLYGLLYVLHGYADHPFEREARRGASRLDATRGRVEHGADAPRVTEPATHCPAPAAPA